MKIKIFSCYHKNTPLLKNKVLEPIQVGKALAKVDLQILGDNTGDNISLKNPHYCELTATYWIWKNIKEVDYVGLFHYRRFFNFKDNARKVYHLPLSVIDDFGLDEQTIQKTIENYDLILPKITRPTRKTLYQNYKIGHVISDMDCVLDILGEKYPEMRDLAEDLLKNNSQGYFGNMLIAKKALFDEYAQWLFSILFEVEKRIHSDVLTRDAYQQRVYGFLAERMMNIFVAYKRQQGCRIKELPSVFVEEDLTAWRKYQYKMFKRRFFSAIGLGLKEWKDLI